MSACFVIMEGGHRAEEPESHFSNFCMVRSPISIYHCMKGSGLYRLPRRGSHDGVRDPTFDV